LRLDVVLEALQLSEQLLLGLRELGMAAIAAAAAAAAAAATTAVLEDELAGVVAHDSSNTSAKRASERTNERAPRTNTTRIAQREVRHHDAGRKYHDEINRLLEITRER